jgi:hypothetical protein
MNAISSFQLSQKHGHSTTLGVALPLLSTWKVRAEQLMISNGGIFVVLRNKILSHILSV